MRLAELATNGTNTVGLSAPDALAADLTWKLPSTDGSNGQALVTNGSGALSWSTPGGAPGGSNTEIQFNNSGAFGGSSRLTWSSGTTSLWLNYQSALRFYDFGSLNYVAFRAANTVSSNVTWTLPSADGTNGQALITDGAGNLSWGAGGGGGSGTVLESAQTISTNISLTSAKNGISVGPVTIATGVSVTIPTGQAWLIL
jgi:hypothetical protein